MKAPLVIRLISAIGFLAILPVAGHALTRAMPVEWIGEATPDRKPAAEGRTEWLKRVIALEKKKDWQLLLDWCRMWTDSEPENPAAWYNLGITYYDVRRYKDAIEAYRHAIGIDPKDAVAWYNLGDAYGHSGNRTAALGAVRELRRLDPALADKLFNLIAPR